MVYFNINRSTKCTVKSKLALYLKVYEGSQKMLRGELTGYDIPVQFNVKSNKATINFQTDENNWGIPNYAYGNNGRWALDFTVIYPTAAIVNAESSSATESTPTIQPTNLGYTCTAECKYHKQPANV